MLRRAFPPVMQAVRAAAAAPGGGGGSSGVTYDTPNLWVNSSTGDDSRSKATVAGSGGSLPWATLGRAVWGNANRATPNASEAAAAGDVVQVAAGTYTTAGFGSSEIVYKPANSGTEGNPIVFQTDQGLVTLNLTSVGSAIGGFSTESWITWRGFTIDDVNNPYFDADGCIHVESTSGITIEDCKVYGRDEDTLDGDQYCAIFWSDVDNLTIRGNLLVGFGGGQDGSGVGSADENATGITGYFRSDDVLIERNTIYYCGSGYYHKAIRNGSGVPSYDTGPVTFRNNKVYSCTRGIRQYIGNHSSADPALFYQNLIYDCDFAGIESLWFGNAVGDPLECTYCKFINNTLYNNGTRSGEGAQFRFSAYPASSFMEFKNNIVVGGEWGLLCFGATMPSNSMTLNRNQVNAYTTAFGFFNSLDRTLAQWQSDTSQDADSITTAPTFTNAGSDDYTLVQNGQPALTLGRVVHGIGGTNGDTIPVGAYITGTETIGR